MKYILCKNTHLNFFFGFFQDFKSDYLLIIILTFLTQIAGAQIHINTNNNVGVGTNTPTVKLEVAGDTKLNAKLIDNTSSAGTSGQLLSSSGNGVQWINPPQTGLGGSGTQNYIPIWNSNNSLGNSIIFQSGSNVGIGITNPQFKLETNGDALINGIRVGKGAGNSSNNTAIGFNSLNSNTTGNFNTAIGYNALLSNQNGNFNVAIGRSALQSSISATNNVAIGYNSQLARTSGSGNLALGFSSMSQANSGSSNIALGVSSLNFCSGSNNIGIGPQTLNQLTTGSGNVAIGEAAGYYTTGSSNLFLGYYAGYNHTGSNQLVIENSNTMTPLIGGDFTSNKVGINKNISNINTTLHVGGDLTVDTRAGTPITMAGFDASGKLVETTLPSSGIGSLTVLNPLMTTGGLSPQLSIQVANTSQSGALTANDWNTFNSKDGSIENEGVIGLSNQYSNYEINLISNTLGSQPITISTDADLFFLPFVQQNNNGGEVYMSNRKHFAQLFTGYSSNNNITQNLSANSYTLVNFNESHQNNWCPLNAENIISNQNTDLITVGFQGGYYAAYSLSVTVPSPSTIEVAIFDSNNELMFTRRTIKTFNNNEIINFSCSSIVNPSEISLKIKSSIDQQVIIMSPILSLEYKTWYP
jgi:hypothetical protein